MLRALIVGHDSELGKLIGAHLRGSGWKVFGTTRRPDLVSDTMYFLDALDTQSIHSGIDAFLDTSQDWDLVVLAIGILTPVGNVTSVDFREWRESIEVNFINQIFTIKTLIEKSSPLVIKNRKILTFAGSGTNSAPKNYSAYTLSKIALIKATEILAVEYPNFTFLSLGTGWMKSPIHQQTLEAGDLAGDAFYETNRRLESDDFGDPVKLLNFIDWFLDCNDTEISGRNIALQGDDWEDQGFVEKLTWSEDSFKLRRSQ